MVILAGGDQGSGLQALIDQLNHASFLPQLSLEQRLDRLAPGLGNDLHAAVSGLGAKQRLAILAAFAVYGVSAREWLDDEPRRVVAELRQRCSDRRSTQRERPGAKRTAHHAEPADDPPRAAAYRQLGLSWGRAVKRSSRPTVGWSSSITRMLVGMLLFFAR